MPLIPGRELRPLILSLFTGITLLGCEGDEPSLVSPLSIVTIRATLPDDTPLHTEFEIQASTEISSFRTRVETVAGVAQVSLPQGSYLIHDLRNDAYYSASGPVSDLERADLIEVERLRSVDIEFRYASLSIRLRSPSGDFVAWKGSPRIIPPSNGYRVHSPNDSVMVVARLTTGEYNVGSFSHDSTWPLTWYPSAPTYRRATPVRLGAGEARSIEITLLPPAFVALECPTPELMAGWRRFHCLSMEYVDSHQHWDASYAECADTSTIIAGPFAPGVHDYDLSLKWHENDRIAARYLPDRQVTLVEYDTTRVLVSSVSGVEVVVDPANANLILYDEGGNEIAKAYGSPALLYADPGEYRMVGTSLDQWRTYWRRHRFFPGADRLVVDDELRRIEWTLVRSSTVRGRVRAEDGTRHPEVRATVVRIFGMTWSRARYVESDGSFAIEGVWPDEYRLRAEPTPESPFRETWFGDTTDPEEAERFTIVEGEYLHDLEIRLVRR